MTTLVAGFPFWQLSFDENGCSVDPAADTHFREDVKNARITDLFVFCHGWNNDRQTANLLYTGFFGEMQTLVGGTSLVAGRKVGVAGVFWPSIKWPDHKVSDDFGAVGLDQRGFELSSLLKKVFLKRSEHQIIDSLLARISAQTPSDEALSGFVTDVRTLLSSDSPTPEYHNLERRAATASIGEWLRILDLLSSVELDDDQASEGGAAGVADFFEKAWRGAKAALRVATYWQMKARAGVVGKTGLGPALSALATTVPTIRVHLIGHSFGARLVSYSLKGLQVPTGTTTPIKSLYLIQGAFSHFAFADALPFDPQRSGDLKGMNVFVDGPLLATHSLLDTAVGVAYPFASVLANQDASAESDVIYRWEGIGHDGAQAVHASECVLGNPPCQYHFEKNKWVNLDANAVIKRGPPPAGAHSDIIHPQTAWACLKAAGLC